MIMHCVWHFRCHQVSRLDSEKLELTGSLCNMQQKLTALEVVVQDLEDERVCHQYIIVSFFF